MIDDFHCLNTPNFIIFGLNLRFNCSLIMILQTKNYCFSYLPVVYMSYCEEIKFNHSSYLIKTLYILALILLFFINLKKILLLFSSCCFYYRTIQKYYYTNYELTLNHYAFKILFHFISIDYQEFRIILCCS